MSVVQMVVFGIAALTLLAVVVWRQPLLAFTQRGFVFSQHVRSELRKVTWPTWDDLRRSTVIVTILVIVIGLIIGVMDALSSLVLIRWLGQVFG